MKKHNMQEICDFHGIKISMGFDSKIYYNKPHFHVKYNEYYAIICVDGELVIGELPKKPLRLIQAWAAVNEENLYEFWNKSIRNEPIGKIRPLKW